MKGRGIVGAKRPPLCHDTCQHFLLPFPGIFFSFLSFFLNTLLQHFVTHLHTYEKQ